MLVPVDSDTGIECFWDCFDVRSGGHNTERNVNASPVLGHSGYVWQRQREAGSMNEELQAALQPGCWLMMGLAEQKKHGGGDELAWPWAVALPFHSGRRRMCVSTGRHFQDRTLCKGMWEWLVPPLKKKKKPTTKQWFSMTRVRGYEGHSRVGRVWKGSWV